MIGQQRVCVILPAYNAARTLEQTVGQIPRDVVDDIVLVDDASADETADIAARLGLCVERHPANLGYGGNQKTCYRLALARGADIIIMLHPDYQYSPRLIPALAAMLASGHYQAVLASRILGKGALEGGMPLYKYVANRVLTLVENWLIGAKLSEYHSGYRAWTRALLADLPLERCSDDFLFDNQMLVMALDRGYHVGEISCPTRYFPEASSIGFARAVVYGLGVLKTACAWRAHRLGLIDSALFRR
ncbi:MAG TPA: glycosyltransferase family 2 protein [Burkholderiales bacterium]|jgi:glycosyltransferase involved in cell wall biosynthesis